MNDSGADCTIVTLDHAARRIESQYFAVISLQKQWSDWVRFIAGQTRISYDKLLTVPAMAPELAVRMQKWRHGAGGLALQILEDVITFLEEQPTATDATLLQTKQRALRLIDEYDWNKLGSSFDEFRQTLWQCLRRRSIEFTSQNTHYVVNLDSGQMRMTQLGQ